MFVASLQKYVFYISTVFCYMEKQILSYDKIPTPYEIFYLSYFMPSTHKV